MSGLAAVFQFDGAPAAADTVGTLLAAMARRGPDGMAVWRDGPVALGACALHTTAEARTASQPYASPDGMVQVVFDGHLSDPAGLRRTLVQRGATPRGSSDEELVMLAWQAWGEDCAQHIMGEFALILWDAHRQHLFCARDHQGLRSLFYCRDGDRLLVASDMAALVRGLGRQPEINRGYLAELVDYQFHTRDETVWRGVLRVVQGHWLCATRSGLITRQYYQLDTTRRLRYAQPQDYVDHYREVLEQCLIGAARTDLPLAFEVSGGLDSTALFCLAHHLAPQGHLPAPALRGYTLAGPPGTSADEVAYVRTVAAELGVEIAEHPYFMPDLAWFTHDAAEALDAPLWPNAIMHRTCEQALVADGCRVSISGIGGDQWLNGSRFYYSELPREGELRRLLAAVRADVADLGLGATARSALYYGISPLLPESVRALCRQLRGLIDLVGEEAAICPLVPELASEVAARAARYQASLPSDRAQRRKLESLYRPDWAPIFDACSRQVAQAGYESRYPMLDRRFIEFMAALPNDVLLQGNTYKALHRTVMTGILPDAVRLRQDKAAMNVTYQRLAAPLRQWLEQDWNPAWDTALDRRELARRVQHTN